MLTMLIRSLILLLICLPLGAQQLSYRDSLEETLRYDPAIDIARRSIELREGLVLEAQGNFDPAATVLFNGSYEVGALTAQGNAFESSRRDLLRDLAITTQRIADDLQRSLDENEYSGIIRCTDEFGPDLEIVIVDPVTGEETVIRCTQETEQDPDNFGEILETLVGVELDPELIELIERLRGDSNDIARAQLEAQILKLNQVARSLRDSLRRIGLVPDERETIDFSLGLGVRKPFRNGWLFTPAIAAQTNEQRFLGKPSDPRFGGAANPKEIILAAGFDLTIPMGRGGGYRVVTANERAAEASLAASNDEIEAVAESQLLSTSILYWNALANQYALELRQRSVERNKDLLGVAGALADAYEIAEVDVDQVRARLAQSELDLIAARRGAINSRIDLAREIGYDVSTPFGLPVIEDEFPAVIDPDLIESLSTTALINLALGARGEIGAAENRALSARILREAAKENIRDRIDLNVFAGFTSYTQNFNYGDGFGEAFGGDWLGPSVSLTLSFDHPFEKKLLKGQYVQSRALEEAAIISSRDQTRLITDRVVSLRGSLAEASRAISEQREVVERFEESLGYEIEKLRLGQATTIDVTLTEFQLTNARLQLIDLNRIYAAILAQFRWATGTLVTRSEDHLDLYDQLLTLPGNPI